jgi:hypothetical protein
MPAGDYTLGQTANDLLVFDGWKCYKANVAGGFLTRVGSLQFI